MLICRKSIGNNAYFHRPLSSSMQLGRPASICSTLSFKIAAGNTLLQEPRQALLWDTAGGDPGRWQSLLGSHSTNPIHLGGATVYTKMAKPFWLLTDLPF
ncbi:hypothetical protein V2G26_003472 [Clonostachys chloroleuca]